MTATLEWMDQALCRNVDVGDTFFPDKGGSNRDAKRICADCPVQAECLAYALDNDERDGVFGGLSPEERHKLSGSPRNHSLICSNCGGEFTSVKRTTRFCGPACSAKALAKRNQGVCMGCGGLTSHYRLDFCRSCSAARRASTLYTRGQAA